MNLILVSNAPIPAICKELKIESSPKEGWVTGLINSLKNEKINIYFVFPHRLNREILFGEIDGVKYYGYPKTKSKDWEYEDIHKLFFINIFKKVDMVDVIHIMGTEMGHTLSAVEAAEEMDLLDKVVVSIQGLTSIIAKHYYANLPHNIIKKMTIRDFLRRDNIEFEQKIYAKRGDNEIQALKKVKHVIGRTDWDKACTFFINPNTNYYFCNETLRETFYESKWEYKNCKVYSIFVSQWNYPVKGFHYMLEALAKIKQFYPTVKLRTTGSNPITNNFIKRQKRTSYINYIEKLIIDYGLQDNLEFLGTLDAEDMKKEYLKANVFVSPSAIENSSNSVAEAMILGTPVVASDVGGIKNLLIHEKEGYIYQCDAPYMLAHYIMDIFSKGKGVECLSKSAREHAKCTHSQKENVTQMMKIYSQIGNSIRYE